MTSKVDKYRIQSCQMEAHVWGGQSTALGEIAPGDFIELGQYVMGIIHAEEGLCAVSPDRRKMVSVSVRDDGKGIIERLSPYEDLLPEGASLRLVIHAISSDDTRVQFYSEFVHNTGRLKVATEGRTR